ncbi:MAG TPA: hypothetical protein VF690_18260, partial [Hymenobacter sp.]
MSTPHFFDDLSHCWQQQPLAPAGGPSEWQALLAGGSRSHAAGYLRQLRGLLRVGHRANLGL